MNIALCTDNNYVMPCGITIISLLENNRDNKIVLHIVGMGLSDYSKGKLSDIIAQYKNASVFFYEMDEDFLKPYGFLLGNSKYLSFATYIRLFLGDLLPADVKKVLYLDSDIIIAKNLIELWNTDITGYSVAGIPDLGAFDPHVFETLGYPSKFEYVNAGVLLINLSYWREKNLIKVFLEFYKNKYSKLTMNDQDIINGTLYDSKLLLPIKFNVIDFYYLTKKRNVYQYQDDINEAIEDPVIIHFNSINKPWLRLSLHPLTNEFLKYKKMSPWAKVPLAWTNITRKQKIRYYKRKLLYALKLKEHKFIHLQKDAESQKYIIIK
ncbi:glycosyltransferase family 8 protein [Dysgonomonas sp. 216]|uniref:glycosyltransferase family 8 protein n=1 Tax=Dysgonomonas sp. 216 TaxID=2302934 RepID=UPI0013D58BEE|nr:glycosyltransferase family 8 protein [Dysgonomonas sp. 216]NDW18226.1 glycosyltransferase family 8 protein [Dysgonomonas sp. 216]